MSYEIIEEEEEWIERNKLHRIFWIEQINQHFTPFPIYIHFSILFCGQRSSVLCVRERVYSLGTFEDRLRERRER